MKSYLIMKIYKIIRGLLKASALTTMMFIMQACYGTPNMPPEMPEESEMTKEQDSIQIADGQVEAQQLDSAQLDLIED